VLRQRQVPSKISRILWDEQDKRKSSQEASHECDLHGPTEQPQHCTLRAVRLREAFADRNTEEGETCSICAAVAMVRSVAYMDRSIYK